MLDKFIRFIIIYLTMAPQKKLDLFYYKLLEVFGEQEFTVDDILSKNIFPYDRDTLITNLNRLEKEGLLESRRSEEDKRKAIYRLLRKPKIDQSNLISVLKRAADSMRNMSEGYKILLVLLFYKIFSNIWKIEYNKIKEELEREGIPVDIAEEEAKKKEHHILDIPEEFLWDNVLKKSEKLVDAVREALIKIGDSNPSIKSPLERLARHLDDLKGKEGADTILRQTMEIFNELDFSSLDFDALGQAYEWLIEQFMPLQKKAGELFTPREVIKLLLSILDPSEERRKILDPAAGSGGMLIHAYKYVKEKYGEETAKKLILVGQEINDDTYAILQLNFLLHGIELGKNVRLYKNDSLIKPEFKNDAPFDIVIFNPPWNDRRYGEAVLKTSEVRSIFEAFGYPPRSSADWGWILLALHFTKEDGKVGIVIDNGALFRGGSEKSIRSKIVDKDWVEAVILLPEKLFYNTGAPGAIIIFNKKKSEERKGKILFINASTYYEKHPYIRKMNKLSEEGINKVTEVYRNWKEVPGFSKIVTLEEIKKNDYNLNVTLYITEEFKDEVGDIRDIWKEFEDINKELASVEESIKAWIEEIKNIA